MGILRIAIVVAANGPIESRDHPPTVVIAGLDPATQYSRERLFHHRLLPMIRLGRDGPGHDELM